MGPWKDTKDRNENVLMDVKSPDLEPQLIRVKSLRLESEGRGMSAPPAQLRQRMAFWNHLTPRGTVPPSCKRPSLCLAHLGDMRDSEEVRLGPSQHRQGWRASCSCSALSVSSALPCLCASHL